MSDSTAFETLKPTLEGFGENEKRKPDMPVEVAVQEGELMYTAALLDAESLQAVGVQPHLIENLGLAVGALRYAQGRWVASLGEFKDWRQKQVEARELRDHLLASIAYATRGVPKAIKALQHIRGSRSDVSVLQDLVALSEMGKKYAVFLEETHFDMTQLDQASELAETLSHLIAIAKIENGSTEAKDWRDRAFTFLRRTMSQILGAAKFTFRKNRDKMGRYFSTYRRRYSHAATKKSGIPPAEMAEVQK